MPDVQKKNNIAISNEWQPPTEPVDSEWQPPTDAINKQTEETKSDWLNSLAKHTLNAPDFVTKGASRLADIFDPNGTTPEGSPIDAVKAIPGVFKNLFNEPLATIRGGLAGATQGAATQLSPANIITSALPEGQALKYTGMGIGGLQATHGLKKIYEEGKWGEGLGDIGFGTLGILGASIPKGIPEGGPHIVIPDIKSKISELIARGYKLVARHDNGTVSMALGESTGKFTPPNYVPSQPLLPNYTPIRPNLGPDFVPVGEEPPVPIEKRKPTEQIQYDLARKKFGMGLDVPKLPHGIKVDEPQFARTNSGGVKIGADIRSLGKVLGSSLYKGNIAKITTKELLQNSMDAVRHLGDKGEIYVELNERSSEPYVEVKDNGKGLSLKEIHSVFSDLGSSGKRSDENAIGGFGLAKAAPLLGGQKVEVTSVVAEKDGIYEHKFEGTPDDLLDGVDIKSRKIPAGESVKTGTTVRTYVPDDSSMYDAKNFLDKITENSDFKGKVHVDKNWGYTGNESNIKTNTGLNLEGANTTTLDTPGAKVDIIIPKGTKYGSSMGVPYEITNNGMWQTSGRVGWDELQGIPEKVIVNIRSKVPEADSDYPFTANREELRGTAEDAVKKFIHENIIKPAQGKRVDELKAAYAGMEHVPLNTDKGPFHREFFVYDVGKRLTPNEIQEIIRNPVIHDLAVDLSKTIHEAMITTDNAKWNEKLEKIGFIFDNKVRGIHIPNPGAAKSAILLNPFQIMSNNTPDKAASGFLHVILHEMAHIAGGGHDEDFAVRLADLYETYGAARSIQAQDKFHETITDATGTNYKPEIQEVLRKYTESRGREATYDDPLYGTGIGSKDRKSDPKKQLPINAGTSSKRTTPEPIVNKLVNALTKADAKREVQESMYSMERAKRIARAEKIVAPDPKTGEIKNTGLEGFYKQKKVLQGELPKVDYKGLNLNESDVDSLIDGITNSQHLLPYEKIRAKVALLKLVGGEDGVPQRNELKLLREVYGAPFDKIIEMHGGLGGPVTMKALMEVANAPKAIMASIDLSAPLRQGLPLIHKKEWWGALRPMVESLAKQKNFDSLQESLHDRPYFLLGKEAGLKLTEVGHDPATREEAYGSNLANLIPGVKASERAYVGFLNKLRADTFDTLIDQAKSEGLHPNDVMHEIANFVNVATGRGSLGRLDKVASELNTVFFSPRLIASRMTILNPNYYVKASPFVRKEALKSLLAIAGAGLTINSLMSAMGATTSFDPTNADFMKSRFGHTRVDPYGGFQQYVVAATRLLTGQTTSSVTGKTSQLEKGFNAQTRLGVVGNFLENKLSPAASLADTLMRGKDFEGKPINMPVEIRNRFTPMLINDLIDIYKDDPNHMPLGIGAALGMGMQTYAPSTNQGSKFKLRLGR